MAGQAFRDLELVLVRVAKVTFGMKGHLFCQGQFENAAFCSKGSISSCKQVKHDWLSCFIGPRTEVSFSKPPGGDTLSATGPSSRLVSAPGCASANSLPSKSARSGMESVP
jgi:hypothetical protein